MKRVFLSREEGIKLIKSQIQVHRRPSFSVDPSIIANYDDPEFHAGLKKAVAVIADFDGTLTKYGSHWYNLAHFMPDQYRQEQEDEREKYHLYGHTVSEEEAAIVDEEWVRSNVDWFTRAGLTEDQLKAAGGFCEPREGLQEFFNLFSKRAVVSYGIVPCIDHFFTRAEVRDRPHFIGATNVALNDGRYSTEEIVTPSKKGIMADRFLAAHGLTSPEALRIGDSWGDRFLFRDDAVNIFMMPLDEPDEGTLNGRMRAIEKLWDQIPLNVLLHDSLSPLNAYIKNVRH